MKWMKLFLVLGVLCGLPKVLNAENAVIVKENSAATPVRPKVYNLNRWVVEENTDPVKRALEVYKQKSASKYVKRVWITDKNTGQRRMIVEYIPRSGDDRVIFSSNEDFMYYLGVTSSGAGIVYGVNLLNDQKFSLGPAQNFNTVNCPDKKSYVVVKEGGARNVYQIYTTAGKSLQTLTNIQNPVDIEKSLCR